MSDVSRVEELFLNAVAHADPAQRAAYLHAQCGLDADLRRRVEVLLAAQPHAHGFLEPASDLTGAYNPGAKDSEPMAAVGDRVGPYKLLEKIGEGGMGEVWVADQLEPIKRRVALKLIKPGMDSRSVLGRFEAERQALAVMDHPNIAKVLDAGTTADGRPYFVMELVKGTPITEFCDARKLTPKQRLELFVPVCQAIQHAHMKGIIHRDIKPSNVLVALHDENPVAKVIDFGVAKAIGQQLTDKTIYTGFGALVGTPAYMAPEQATFNQLDVDTRADVYALGVLLYELLAGSPPIEAERMKKAALDEVLRIVRDEEPPRPSHRLSTSQAKASIAAVRGSEAATLSALMKGELDWIVMKALEKDRTRRYDTANGLAKDILRYLSGDSVEACPPTLSYRLRKAYRRNKTAVRVAGAFVCLAMVAVGMGAYVLQQRFARQTATEQAVNEALSKATLLRGQAKAAPVGELGRWKEALAAANQAEASLQTGEPSASLRQRVTELVQTLESEQTEASKLASENEKDRKLFDRIEAIRVKFVDAEQSGTENGEHGNAVATDEAYANAFREFGIDADQVDPTEAGRLLRRRSRPLKIALAIDNWALIRKDLARNEDTIERDPEKERHLKRLIELAKTIDDDPWRCAIRSEIESASPYNFIKLLENEQELSKQPARSLYVLALMFRDWGKSDNQRYFPSSRLSTAQIAMLKRAWQLSPGDFQICWTLSQQCPDELDKHAFAMAAAAAAPDSPFARKLSPTAPAQAEKIPLLSENEFVRKGDKSPEWKFPHLVIESPIGDKVFLGPTRYNPPTEEEIAKLNSSVNKLRWAIRLNPSSVELRENLAKTLVRIKQFDEAVKECEAISKLDPMKSPAVVIAYELYGMGQLDRARELIEQKLKSDPKGFNAELNPTLAAIHTELGNRTKAFEAFRDSYISFYEINSGSGVISTSFGREEMECVGTTEQVVAAYRTWFAHEMVGNRIVEEYGNYLERHGKTDDALSVYREALSREGGERFLSLISRLLLRTKRSDEAIELYRQRIAKDPKNLELRGALAKLYGQTGKAAERTAQLNELVADYLEQIKTKPKDEGLHYKLADVYSALGKKDEARKSNREWIKGTTSALSLNSFAMDYATDDNPKRRDGELAVEAATRACELTGYADSMILDTLATAYAETGDFEAAVKWQLKAIEMIVNERDREELENNLKLFRDKKKVAPNKSNEGSE